MRETYEWCDMWWDNPEDTAVPRILLIGDSISVGYSKPVTDRLQGRFRVDRLSTSKAITDRGLYIETDYILNEYKYEAIHVNNGLHGVHLTDTQYAEGLRKYLIHIREIAGDAKLIWCSSTPVTVNGKPEELDIEINAQVMARNKAAANLAQELGIEINDLFSKVIGRPEIRCDDGYHYLPEGYAEMADAVSSSILAGL